MKKYFVRKFIILLLVFTVVLLPLSSCNIVKNIIGNSTESQSKPDVVFEARNAKTSLRIVSGSENKILEPIIEEYVKKNNTSISIKYMGSLDIMRLLSEEHIPYDAVWPASSLWISVGDNRHLIKHAESTSTTPVIFGVRESKAKELNWIDKDEIFVRDILDAIMGDKLKFTMTSATQSNSGASAYIGFLYALLDSPDQISLEDLQKPSLQEDIRNLLQGVERSSGSSDWLKDLYLQGNYDAMVNYEALIIDANKTLEANGQETMHAIYPVDGMVIADSPLGFVSNNGEEKRDEKQVEEAFLAFQSHLLSKEIQDTIQKTGRRTGFEGVSEANKAVFKPEWGLDTETVISTFNMPKQNVLLEALNLYQREFKKPGLNIYVLDYSGSMAGSGYQQLMGALNVIMDEEQAKQTYCKRPMMSEIFLFLLVQM